MKLFKWLIIFLTLFEFGCTRKAAFKLKPGVQIGEPSSTGTAPSSPSGLYFTWALNQITLNWSAADRAQNYRIFRGTVSGNLSELDVTASTTFTDQTFTADGSTIYYTVIAENASGASNPSDEISVLPLGSLAFSSLVGLDSSIQVSWTNSPGASSYTLSYGTSSGTYDHIVSTSATSPTTVTGLTNGTTYYFMIKATNASVGDVSAPTETSGIPGLNLAKDGGDNQTQAVTQTLSTPLKVILTESSGAPVVGTSVTWSVQSGGGSLSSCSTSTDSSGFSSCTLTLGSTVGSNTVRASVLGGAISVTFTATATHGPADHLTFTTEPSGAVAGVALTTQPVVKIYDAYENVVTTGADSTAIITMTLTSGTGSLSGTSSATAVAGVATWSDLALSTTGSKVLTATKPNLTASGGTSILSQTSQSTTVSAPAPAAPGNLALALDTSGQIELTWDSTTYASTYQIVRGTVSGALSNLSSTSSTTFTDTTANPGTLYYYAVSASGTGGTSSLSSEISGTALGSFSIGSATANHSSVDLVWSTSSGATSYVVKYGTSVGVYGTTFSSNASSPTTITGLTNGTTYYIMVESVNASGARTASAPATAIPGMTMSLVAGNSQTGVVGQTLSTALSINIKDSSNANLSGISISWSVSGGGGSLSNCSTTTNASGVATCDWTLGTTAETGIHTVLASAAAGTQTQTFNATATHGPADHLLFYSFPTIGLQDIAWATQPVVKILDVYNNLVTSGADATAQITLNLSSGSGILYSSTTSCTATPSACRVTASGGIATFSSLSIDTAQGTAKLTATKQDLSGSSGVGPLSLQSTALSINACNSGSTCPGCWKYTSGSGSWTVPSNWNSSSNVIELIGGGGAGGNGDWANCSDAGGGGGGGGSYLRASNFNLTPNDSISYTIGMGGSLMSGDVDGSDGNSGSDTFFKDTSYAKAGGGGAGLGGCSYSSAGGVGGIASGSLVGISVTRSGGTGGSADTNYSCYSGGQGGGAGGSTTNGQSGVSGCSSNSGNSGDGGGTTIVRGLNSGNGGVPGLNSSTDGEGGTNYGGGGGGGSWNTLGGTGGSGLMIIKCD